MGEVKIYCESCGDHQPLEIEEMASDDLNGDSIFGDLLCATCHLVLNTLVVPEPGIWKFVKEQNI